MTSSKRSVKSTEVLIPVTGTILVPVTIDQEVDGDTIDASVGVPIINIMDADNADDVIAAATQAAMESEEVTYALESLVAGIRFHQQSYPTTRGRYTMFLGLAKEQEL